jgi:hypothetical protein
MHRTLVFNLQELWHDHRDVANRINHACFGSTQPLQVRGMAQIAERVYVYLLPTEREQPESYVLAPWEDESVEGIAGCLSSRWSAGFDLVGSVRLDEGQHLLLLARGEEPRA